MRVNIKSKERKKVKGLTNNDPWLAPLMRASYSQIDNWMDNTITDLASTKRLLKLIVKMLVFLIRRQI
jgi:hypothetical protein